MKIVGVIRSGNFNGHGAQLIRAANDREKRTAAVIPGLITKGVFKRGYVSGILGAKAKRPGSPLEERDLDRAKALGARLVRDIRSCRRYVWPHRPVG